ncbi:Zinc-binding dehydrogenase [Ceratobasidium sp. AG-Ba]|nr:Zinc-binding dehydrogenase [Ceratobasidium sp. AG-Ba]
MSQQKASVLPAKHGKLEVRNRSIPTPQAKQILVKVTSQLYTLVDSEILAKIPSNINEDQASTLPLGSVTAVLGLFQESGIAFPKGWPNSCWEVDLCAWGSSSVGQFVIQLARIAGFSPIVTTASAQHADFLKSLGATHVFDRNVDSKTVQEAFSGLVSLVFCYFFFSTQKLAVDVLKGFSRSQRTLHGS